MRLPRLWLVWVATLGCGIAIPRAAAAEGPLFVGGWAFVGLRPSTPAVPASDVAGMGVGFGAMLSDGNTIRFDQEMPQTGRSHQVFGGALGDGTRSTQVVDDSVRTTMSSILVGLTIGPRRHVTPTLLYGMSIGHETRLTHIEEVLFGRDGTVLTHHVFDNTDVDVPWALTGGLEVAVSMTDHFWLTPNARFHWLIGGAVLSRVGIGGQWRF